jgi:hypothetical protein
MSHFRSLICELKIPIRILDLRRKALPTETELLRQHSVLIEDAFANNDLWAIEDGS